MNLVQIISFDLHFDLFYRFEVDSNSKRVDFARGLMMMFNLRFSLLRSFDFQLENSVLFFEKSHFFNVARESGIERAKTLVWGAEFILRGRVHCFRKYEILPEKYYLKKPEQTLNVIRRIKFSLLCSFIWNFVDALRAAQTAPAKGQTLFCTSSH